MQSVRELWHANQVEWLHEVTLTGSWGKNKKIPNNIAWYDINEYLDAYRICRTPWNFRLIIVLVAHNESGSKTQQCFSYYCRGRICSEMLTTMQGRHSTGQYDIMQTSSSGKHYSQELHFIPEIINIYTKGRGLCCD